MRIAPIDIKRWNGRFRSSRISFIVEMWERGFLVLAGGSYACGCHGSFRVVGTGVQELMTPYKYDEFASKFQRKDKGNGGLGKHGGLGIVADAAAMVAHVAPPSCVMSKDLHFEFQQYKT